MMFFANFVTVYIKMIVDFKNFLFAFPWWPHGAEHKQITKSYKGVEKYTVLVMSAV